MFSLLSAKFSLVAIYTETLAQALRTLEEALTLYDTHPDQGPLRMALLDSVTQRFEYTYELAWKLVQRWVA